MAATGPAAASSLHERIPAEAVRLVERAGNGGRVLRVAGSVAVRLHCAAHAATIDALGRRRFRDIDFWGYSEQQNELQRLLQGEGYVADPRMKHMREWGVKRLIYEHPETRVHVDVFMDDLVMAHTIGFKGRLELDSPTVPLADLLLSKLQIHEITENDLIDVTVLLAEHDLGAADPELIDVGRVAAPLAASWGFFHTTMQNLEKCGEALDRYGALPPEVAARVRERLGALSDAIEMAPKSRRWKLRAKVGTRSQWYENVDEVDR